MAAPETQNLRGRAFRIYDGAGLLQSNAFDFRGNLLAQSRQLTVAYDTSPSWTALDGLTTIAELDAAAAPLLEEEAEHERHCVAPTVLPVEPSRDHVPERRRPPHHPRPRRFHA